MSQATRKHHVKQTEAESSIGGILSTGVSGQVFTKTRSKSEEKTGIIVTDADLPVRLTSQWLLELDFDKCCSERLRKIVP